MRKCLGANKSKQSINADTVYNSSLARTRLLSRTLSHLSPSELSKNTTTAFSCVSSVHWLWLLDVKGCETVLRCNFAAA